ncbi:hypothetical protein HRI_000777700 [Hibiscus trionum]|uniref:thioredoxin-dependent peroxiredoxin n=1 Tax=Hibiscus trionum TaxID=183268 RepID=A0A9W7H4U9_HIBTR|nr:hypothetical protein HRI_000777700 [Hibiscus trionum]
MTCSVTSTTAALISSNPRSRAFSPISYSLSLPNSFTGLRAPLLSRIARSLSVSRAPILGGVSSSKPAVRFHWWGILLPISRQRLSSIRSSSMSSSLNIFYMIFASYSYFYPPNFFLLAEITAFSYCYEEFEKLNTEILGVSIDSVFSHLAWVQIGRKSGGLGDLKYPLISEATKSISKSYGVLIPDQIRRGSSSTLLLTTLQLGEVLMKQCEHSSFLCNMLPYNLVFGPALPYNLGYGEVCPAGWKPGQKSMKPDPKLRKDYFAAI